VFVIVRVSRNSGHCPTPIGNYRTLPPFPIAGIGTSSMTPGFPLGVFGDFFGVLSLALDRLHFAAEVMKKC